MNLPDISAGMGTPPAVIKLLCMQGYKNNTRSEPDKPMPAQNENKNHMLQDESIAALGVSLGAAVGILVDNMILGICCAAGLFLAARVYAYTRLEKRS